MPTDEGYQQAGTADYHPRAQSECQIYKKQLLRLFPIPDSLKELIRFEVDPFQNAHCIYYEVVINFDGGVEEASQFAENVKANRPSEWDEQATKQLEALHLIPV
ncbi:hypothetical protein [Nostoc linckia]|uniref:hypothetical protein n=1 Tax=Nostoc linckia TaxID=92942 RepID=UPI0011817507|nr:hypothetical protein [Nostoc linckia]